MMVTFPCALGRAGRKKAVLVKYIMDVHWLRAGSVLDKQAEWAATKIGKSTFQKFLETPDEKLLTDDEALANSINLSYEAPDRSFARCMRLLRP
jgi:hypothetical protein